MRHDVLTVIGSGRLELRERAFDGRAIAARQYGLVLLDDLAAALRVQPEGFAHPLPRIAALEKILSYDHGLTAIDLSLSLMPALRNARLHVSILDRTDHAAIFVDLAHDAQDFLLHPV